MSMIVEMMATIERPTDLECLSLTTEDKKIRMRTAFPGVDGKTRIEVETSEAHLENYLVSVIFGDYYGGIFSYQVLLKKAAAGVFRGARIISCEDMSFPCTIVVRVLTPVNWVQDRVPKPRGLAAP